MPALTPDDAPTSVDTNVLMFARRPQAVEHVRAQEALASLRRAGAVSWLSRQVLRECLAASTRPLRSGLALIMSEAVADVRPFAVAFNVVDADSAVFDKLLELLSSQAGGGKQVHDANVAATMLSKGLQRLLTFNGAVPAADRGDGPVRPSRAGRSAPRFRASARRGKGQR